MKYKIKPYRKKGGFSLIELIVVITIVSLVVIISTGPISSIFRARKKAVANEISAMLSQCKINELSGIKNRFELSFDEANDCYICSLIYTSGDKAGTAYKTEKIGSGRNNIMINDAYPAQTNKLTVSFSGKTGAVTYFECGPADFTDESTNKITVDSSNYEITLYMMTGKQEVSSGLNAE